MFIESIALVVMKVSQSGGRLFLCLLTGYLCHSHDVLVSVYILEGLVYRRLDFDKCW